MDSLSTLDEVRILSAMALDPNRWTLKTQEAINQAVETARRESNPEVTPDHLLAALLGQAEGIVLPIVQRVGKTPLELRNATAEVSVDHRRPTRKGLGIICAATQYSDAFTIDRLRTAGGTVQETWDAPTLSEPYSGAAPAGPTQPEPEAEFRAPDFGKGFGF